MKNQTLEIFSKKDLLNLITEPAIKKGVIVEMMTALLNLKDGEIITWKFADGETLAFKRIGI